MYGGQTIRPGTPPHPRLADLRAYDPSGVGHVVPGRHATRHPCGEPVRAERFAHPAKVPCPSCVGTPITESELRALHGDR